MLTGERYLYITCDSSPSQSIFCLMNDNTCNEVGHTDILPPFQQLTWGFLWKITTAWEPRWCPCTHGSWQTRNSGQRSACQKSSEGFFLIGAPLKVLSVRLHSKSHQQIPRSEFTYRLTLRIFRGAHCIFQLVIKWDKKIPAVNSGPQRQSRHSRTQAGRWKYIKCKSSFVSL